MPFNRLRGSAKKTNSKNPRSGWVGPGHTRIFLCGKSSKNSSKPVLIFWIFFIICILSVYTLIKVVSYYDLSVLSMSVMGFQKKFGWGGWVGLGGWVG